MTYSFFKVHVREKALYFLIATRKPQNETKQNIFSKKTKRPPEYSSDGHSSLLITCTYTGMIYAQNNIIGPAGARFEALDSSKAALVPIQVCNQVCNDSPVLMAAFLSNTCSFQPLWLPFDPSLQVGNSAKEGAKGQY